MHGYLMGIFMGKIPIVGGKMNIYNPISCEWNLTFKCNLKCSFCSLSCSPQIMENNFWSNDNINRIVSELKKNNVVYVSLTGGEPLMSKDIFKIIDILYANHFVVTLASNGLLINEKFLSATKEKIKWIQVSLQSLNSDYNERKMGVSSGAILESVNRIVKAGIGISIATINFQDENQELPNLVKFLDENNIKHYIRRLMRPKKFISPPKKCESFSRSIPYFCILPNGNVAQCAELGVVAGNILDENLDTILKKAELRYCNPSNGCLLVEETI